MPVKPLIRITEGWKHDENKRFGACVELVIEAHNVVNDELKVFHYAPTLIDLPLIRRMCDMVEEVDKHNKSVYALQQEALNFKLEEGSCDGEYKC